MLIVSEAHRLLGLNAWYKLHLRITRMPLRNLLRRQRRLRGVAVNDIRASKHG